MYIPLSVKEASVTPFEQVLQCNGKKSCMTIERSQIQISSPRVVALTEVFRVSHRSLQMNSVKVNLNRSQLHPSNFLT